MKTLLALVITLAVMPNIANVDVTLKGMNGQQITHEVNKERIATKVLVITAYDEPHFYEEDCGQCRLCYEEPGLKASCGVARLLEGEEKVIEPSNLVRGRRNHT